MNHREPRAFQQAPLEDDDEGQVPGASPALIEYLEKKFPVRLSVRTTAEATLTDQAEMRGQQEVIDFLRKLSNRGA